MDIAIAVTCGITWYVILLIKGKQQNIHYQKVKSRIEIDFFQKIKNKKQNIQKQKKYR